MKINFYDVGKGDDIPCKKENILLVETLTRGWGYCKIRIWFIEG